MPIAGNDNTPTILLHPAALWLDPLTRQGVETILNLGDPPMTISNLSNLDRLSAICDALEEIDQSAFTQRQAFLFEQAETALTVLEQMHSGLSVDLELLEHATKIGLYESAADCGAPA
jgi:hypothetical protein